MRHFLVTAIALAWALSGDPSVAAAQKDQKRGQVFTTAAGIDLPRDDLRACRPSQSRKEGKRPASRFFGHIGRYEGTTPPASGIGEVEGWLRDLVSDDCDLIGSQWCKKELPEGKGHTTRSCWEAARNLLYGVLFGSSGRSELPDVIVFLERNPETGRLERHRPSLIWKHGNTPHLFGADHIWVLVLSEERLPLEAEIITLYQRPGNPFIGLLGLFNITGPSEDAQKAAETEVVSVDWGPLIEEGDRVLYQGWARLPVGIDSMNHLTLRFRQPEHSATWKPKNTGNLDAGYTLQQYSAKLEGPDTLYFDDALTEPEADFWGVSLHFSNSKPARAAFSLALAATFDVSDTALGRDGTENDFNGYAFGKVFLLRPRLKAGSGRLLRRSRLSVSLVGGTNLSGDTFDEFVVGFSIGHLFDKVGIILGGNRTPAFIPETKEGEMSQEEAIPRKWRAFFGVEYTF